MAGLERDGHLGLHTSVSCRYSLHMLSFVYVSCLYVLQNHKNEVDLLDAKPIPEKSARQYGDGSSRETELVF